MAYSPIASAIITLQSSGLTGAGFGTPLFATANLFSFNRVEAYTSLEEVASVFPATSPAYLAAEDVFSATPRPSLFKIGNILSDIVVEIPSEITSTFLEIVYIDGVSGLTEVLGLSTTGQIDGAAVATALASQVNAELNLQGAATAVGTTLTITPAADSVIKIGSYDVPNISISAGAKIETNVNAITKISEADSDYYFLMVDERDSAEVSFISSYVESLSAPKMFFTAVSGDASFSGSGVENAISVSSLRTVILHHDSASTGFPEAAFVGYNAPYSAGTVTWSNLRTSLNPSKNASGTNLTAGQKGNLENFNISYIDNIGGLAVLRGGKVRGGEAIDTIRGRDAMINEIEVGLTNLLISQQGTKLPYTNAGINAIASIVRNILNQYVEKGFINVGFKTTFLDADRVPVSDKQANIYQSGSFSAELTGAILESRISGSLVLDLV